MKIKFLKLYSLSFVQNKKRNLNIDFDETNSLRSFVELKLTSLSTFTTLPFVNQVEMVINDLPEQVSAAFIVNEKITGNKTEILNFCDTIQDVFETFTTTNDRQNEADHAQPSGSNMEMEIFTFEPKKRSVSEPSRGGRGSNRGVRGGKITKKGRPAKKLTPIVEDTGSTDSFGFLGAMDNSSRSSWTDCN